MSRVDTSDQRGVRAVVNDDRPPSSGPTVDIVALRALAEATLGALSVAGPAELALTLVDVEEITRLNREHLGATGPTDVLSFPLDVDDGASSHDEDGFPRLLGDVAICPEVAFRNAPEHTGDFADEMALLCVHGILHVLGHDHAEPGEARAMRTLEARLLSELHRPVRVGTVIPT